MRDTTWIVWRRFFFQPLARAFMVGGLVFCAFAAMGLPRGPFPPVPESGVIYHQGFDGVPAAAWGNPRIVIPGFGTLVESWSGYALERAGTNVVPWMVPAVNVNSGHTNLTCDQAGAVRFYFAPRFSSASISGDTGPGATARLADLVATSQAGAVVVWSLQISADGTAMRLLGYGDDGPVELFSAPIAWQAGQYHMVALNYGPQGTALMIDGQVVAQGGGTVAVSTSGSALVLGSSIAGTDTAQGEFDEFFSFDHQLTPTDAAFYYVFTGAAAALGPISAKEAAGSVLTGGAQAQMALKPVYDPDHDMTCSPGGPVYITNIFATLQTNGLMTFSFDVQGGTNGVFYDILSTTNLNNTLDNSQWTWVGQALTCNTYSFSNQPAGAAFYILEVPPQTTVWAWGNNVSGQCNVPLGLISAQAIAAGGDFSLALLTNNTVVAWGTNNYGQTSVPAGLTNVVCIAAGQYHGLALLTNGAVTNWGVYWDGVTNYPVTSYYGLAGPPTSNVMAIAAGAGHDLALLSNGTVVCWGLTNLYPTSTNALPFQTNLTGVKAIACGWNHNVALLSNGVVKAWSVNSTNAGWNLTNVPGDLTNVVAISAFGLNSMALRTNGTVEVWGVNDEGQTNVPAGLSNVVAIAAGAGLSLALQANGNLVVWGNTNLLGAALPTNMLGVKVISAGFQHNLAIASDGLPPLLTYPPAGFAPSGSNFTFSVTGVRLANVQYQWQFNGTNITGATNATLTLTSVNSADDGSYQVVITNSSGSATSMAATFGLAYPPQIVSTSPSAGVTWITTNTSLSIAMSTVGASSYPLHYQWQFNGTNIAAATNSIYTIFNPVATNEGNYTVVVTNALGSTNATWSLRLAWPGMVEAWGSDASGEINRPASLTNAAGIAAGEYQSVAVTDSGTIVQWGQYSDGTNFYSVTNLTNCSPPPASNVVAVAAGLGQALALLNNGTVAAWGLTNAGGYVAYGTEVLAGISNVIAIACGWQFDVALLSNGTVRAWGLDDIGIGYTMTNVPVGLSNVTAIAAGPLHTLALQSNGTVVAWGYSPNGETNVPAGLSNVVAIAAGEDFNLALTANGKVVAWGGVNDYGQTNVPAGLSNVMAIAAGDYHGVALLNTNTLVEWGDNSSGQATVPSLPPATFNLPPFFPGVGSQPPIVVKRIAAGGDHTLAAIFSPLVQYQVDVTQDLLLIYNTNSTGNGSSNVCAYYRANRPMVSNANVLAIGCTNAEIIAPPDYTNIIAGQIQNWLAANPTKRPQYVILFQDIPSRLSYVTGGGQTPEYPSVQYEIHTTCATNWSPFVTSINMNGTGGTNDCIAYINKLQSFGTNGQLFISPSSGGYSNTNWYFDYAQPPLVNEAAGYGAIAEQGVTNVNPSASVFSTSYPYRNGVATNVVGYFTCGYDCTGYTNMFISTNVCFYGQSQWFIMSTIDSFSGERNGGQAPFLTWFASNSFSGTNYSNTPVGAVTYVDEPNGYYGHVSPSLYYGNWALGKSFAISAWAAQSQAFGGSQYYQVLEIQAVGDPFVRK